MTLRLAVVTPTPEVRAAIPVALLSGSFAQRMQKAVQMGYDGVELMVVRPDELEATDIRAQILRCGLQIAAVASGAIKMVDRLTLLAQTQEMSQRAAERLSALIDFAAILNAPLAALVTIGGFRGRLADVAWIDRVGARRHLVEVLQQAADHAAQSSVRLALEPLNRYESDVVNTVAEGLALADEVGRANFGLLIDTFHANIEEASMSEPFKEAMAAGKLFHVHLGDSNRLPPGQGHIDFAGIVTTLQEVGYNGYLSAELFPRPDADMAAVATIQHMRRFVAKT